MDSTLALIQRNLWQAGFVALLFVCVLVPFILVRRRVSHILAQAEHWRELEKNIPEVGKDAVRFYPNPTRHVLLSVFAAGKGTARAGAVPAALEYFAAEVESPIVSLRSLSYLAVLIGLLGTVTMLALALNRMDSLSQFKADLIKNIYPINAFAIALAVVIFLTYSWYRHQGDQLLLLASRTLGRLKMEELGGADPQLLAALEKVSDRFREWGNDLFERYQGKIDDLVQEMRDLSEAVQVVVGEAVLSRKEEDRSIMPLLVSQDAKIELLSQRLEQEYLELRQSEGGDINTAVPGSIPGKTPGGKPGDGRKKAPGFFRRVFG